MTKCVNANKQEINQKLVLKILFAVVVNLELVITWHVEIHTSYNIVVYPNLQFGQDFDNLFTSEYVIRLF